MQLIHSLMGKRIFVAGHKGMVGAAIMRRLSKMECEILTVDRKDVDLTRQEQVRSWFEANKPQAVFLAAAKVGGIRANSEYPADFLYQNLMIESNVIDAAFKTNVEKLLFLGSSCIYPKNTLQPISEDALLTGALESTNEWYAIAKIAGIKLCQAYRRQYGCDFISAMPTNLYGPGDNYDLSNSHVLPALIRKTYEAKLVGSRSVQIWGTGRPRREFLHCDDCADAVVFLFQHYSDEAHVNVGLGKDIEIIELARLVSRVVGFEGDIIVDPSKPDGTMAKRLDVTKLSALGWRPSIKLDDGVKSTFASYLNSLSALHDQTAKC